MAGVTFGQNGNHTVDNNYEPIYGVWFENSHEK